MAGDAYVFGDLVWPMPDLGLVAVWRAMSLDASRWDDWEGFVEGLREGTVGATIDKVLAAPAVPFVLDVDEMGARLRARVDDDTWRWLAIAWRSAADLGASGEFGWRPCALDGPAYRAVIRDYNSQWEKVPTIEVPHQNEIDALVAAQPRAIEIVTPVAEPAPAAPAPEPVVEPEAPQLEAIDPDEIVAAIAPEPRKPTKKAAAKKPAAKAKKPAAAKKPRKRKK
jgi:hypothetical protein